MGGWDGIRRIILAERGERWAAWEDKQNVNQGMTRRRRRWQTGRDLMTIRRKKRERLKRGNDLKGNKGKCSQSEVSICKLFCHSGYYYDFMF